jgi:hypothetical protein
MSASRKGFIPFAILLLIISIMMYMVLILDTYHSVSTVVGIKGTVEVFMSTDDRGTDITSLLNSQRSGVKGIETLGMLTLKTSTDSEEDIQIKNILDSVYIGYDLTLYGPYGNKKFGNAPEDYVTETDTGQCGVIVDDEISLETPIQSSPIVTSGFGYRELRGICDCHGGVDFRAGKNTPIYASADGRVWRISYDSGGYGRYIVLQHTFGDEIYYTIYADLESIDVSQGQEVSAGEVIGRSGNTGSGEYHLHFELRRNVNGGFGVGDKDSVNPCSYLSGLDGCEHEPVQACRLVENKNVDVLRAQIPLPGARTGYEKADLELRKWD